MLDATLQKFLRPPLDWAGARLSRLGVGANAVTFTGALFALAAILSVSLARFGLALIMVLICRMLDGLDGAVARCSQRTDLGGYLDIVADYVFYAGIPLGFAVLDPVRNALPAAALLGSFVLTSASFLAFAALSAKRNHRQEIPRQKSFFYSHGLMEGGESIAFFIAMILWPSHFPALAWIFAAMCLLTAVQRSLHAMQEFRD